MNLIDIASGPWAIRRSTFAELQTFYSSRLQGERIDVSAVEARLGRPLANSPAQYQLEGSVAVVPISGVIVPKGGMLVEVSGATSAQVTAALVRAADEDPAARSIVLMIDSPGGSVLGIPELADTVRAARKPVYAITDGTMASAAYWVAAGALALFATGPTTTIGSIGVVATHRFRDDPTTITTEITAGRYKRVASTVRPLDAEGEAYIQAQVDYLYGLFVDWVALCRGVTADQVVERMADGREFFGPQALVAGLIDGMMSLEAMLAKLNEDPWSLKAQHGRRRVITVPANRSTSPSRASASAETTPTIVAVATPVITAPRPPAPPPAAAPVDWRDAWLAQAQGARKAHQDRVDRALVATMLQCASDVRRLRAGWVAHALPLVRTGRQPLDKAMSMVRDHQPAAAFSAVPSASLAPATKGEQVAQAQAFSAVHGVPFLEALHRLGVAA